MAARKRPRPHSAESLERRLLLATISGVKWNDADGDGTRDTGEAGLAGWTIFVDANGNGVRDSLEPSDVTDAAGAYSITATGRAGTFVSVREIAQAGWRPSFPTDGEHTIAFPSTSVGNINFGNTQRGLVTGTKFNDFNDNGRRDLGERGLQGWRIFADTDGDGVLGFREPSDLTDAAGAYALNVAPGSYTLREVAQVGWWQTLPASGSYAVTLAQGQVAPGRDFGNVAITYDLVGAALFVTSPILPVPGDGRIDLEYAVRNDGTGPSPAFSVALYLSDDGTISTADTLLRTVAWSSVPRHDTVTRTITVTLPRPDPYRTDNEYFIGMIVDSANVVAETDETNNSNRGLALDSFPLASEEHLPRPVDNTSARATPITFGTPVAAALGDEWIGAYDVDTYRFDVEAGHNLEFDLNSAAEVAWTLRLYDASWTLLWTATYDRFYLMPATGRYYAVVSDAANAISNPRSITGRAAGVTGAYTFSVADKSPDIYADFAGGGGQPPGPSSINFRIEGGRMSSEFNVSLYLSDDNQISTADRLVTTVRVNSANYKSEYGYYLARADFTLPPVDPFVTDNQYWVGLIVDSSNEIIERNEANNSNRGALKDMVSWRSEMNIGSPADGQRVGSYSSTGFGNPLAASIGNEWIGPYDQDLFPVYPNANETLNFDIDRTGGTLDSYVRLYDDAWNLLAANDNGAAPGEGAGIDSFLRHSFTVGGTYWVVVSGRGNHTNHPLLLTGRTAASTGDFTLTTTSEPAGDVTGIVFHDADADGIQDPGETGLEGRRVYIDSNDDERFFEGSEPSTLTNADGVFRFSGLRPDTYVFRQIAPPGWIPTAPVAASHTLVLTSGQPAGPIAFGAIQQVTFSGTAFNDLDGDGTRDAGEGGRAGVVAYADLNNNGVRDLTTVTLSLPGVPLDIPAGNRTTFTIEGPPSRPLVVADVDVLMDVWDFNYEAYLYHAGVNLLVLNDNFPVLARNPWRIDDEAATTTGLHRRPLEPLSALDGSSAGGKWRLSINDQRPGGFLIPHGRLYSWSLALTLSEPFAVTDATGVYTLAGLLPGAYNIRADREADWIPTAPASGVHDATLAEGASAAGLDFGARQRRLQITARHVFYNNSAFDGRDPAASAADDNAIAPDKTPLRAGGTRSAANVTGYAKGINGIMVDVEELLAETTLADFTFKVPSSFDPSLWLDAPAPSGFAVRAIDPADPTRRRVTLTWPDNQLRNVWLQVGVRANASTRLAAADVFYVGNLIGETGDAVSPGRVSVVDWSATRANISFSPRGVGNPFDHNRDGFVNIRDLRIVRSHLGRVLPNLVQASAAAVPAAPKLRARPPTRSGWTAELLDP